MGLSDDVDEAEAPDFPVGALPISLNGLDLSEVADYESEAYGLPRGRPVEMGMVKASFVLDNRGNVLDVRMRAEDAEQIAYDLLTKAEEARGLVDHE